MRTYGTKFLFLLLLTVFCFTGCQVYTLTDALPPLLHTESGLPDLQSIHVVRLSDNVSVQLTTPDALSQMMTQLDGIQAIREKTTLFTYQETHPLQYLLLFQNENGEETLVYVSDQTHFFLDTPTGYAYEALRGGLDMVYIEHLFVPTDIK